MVNCPASLKGSDECHTAGQSNGKKDIEVLILDGRQLARAPKYQFNLSTRYDFELFDNSSYARLGYRWKDDIQYSFDHKPETEHPAFGVLDFNLATSGEFGSNEYKVNLFMKNVLDKTYYSRLAGRSGGGVRGVIAKSSSRYIGASVTLSF